MHQLRMPRVLAVLLFMALLAFSGADDRKADHKKGTASPDQVELINHAAQQQLEALENPVPFEFQERLEWNWGTETRSVIETIQGRADRIIRFGDEPLSSDQQEKQEHRLKKLLSDHDSVKSELQDQRAETQRRIKMVKAFPRAFFFDFAGEEKGLLHFHFFPNPDFSPKDRESQMYRGMEGELWIEPRQERMLSIEGKLVKDVSFGWGVLGHLNKGGMYEIAQTQLAPGTWRITTLNVDVKGRMLFVESFRFLRKETDTHIRRTPASMTYEAAVTSLLTSPSGASASPPPFRYFSRP
jgi:hypothetical protein